MTPENIHITELIPQRPPIVMVSNLVKFDDKSAVSVLNISSNGIFCKNGALQECGLIENIAQTAAAMNGYASMLKNESVKLGFIGAIKNLQVYKLPLVNTTIETTVTIENKVMNVDIIKGVVQQNNCTIAECEMKIFIEE